MQASISCSIRYGSDEIEYDVLFVNRETMEISVHPNKAVIVKAPLDTTLEKISQKVRKRIRWIRKQIRYFSQFDPRTPERQYVGGESHLYLGKQYRLKIVQGLRNHVLLSRGFFWVESPLMKPELVRQSLDNWYRERAHSQFENILHKAWENFEKYNRPKPTLRIQKMQSRWGSLSKQGTLTLNVDLIRAPKDCIEYVIFHELCHLIHHNHGPEFYKLLDQTLPGWSTRKHKLEMALI